MNPREVKKNEGVSDLDMSFSLVEIIEEFIEIFLKDFLERSLYKIPGGFFESVP